MKIYFHTFGCKVNQYETQLLRETLTGTSSVIADSYKEADICIINSCTVTHNADADCRKIVRRIRRANKKAKIIVTGCYAIRAPHVQTQTETQEVEIYPDKYKIPEIWGSPAIDQNLLTISSFYNHSRAFVKIQDGCDAFCSYCIVPYVRNKLWSKPKNIVITEIKKLVSNGYKEVVLCGIRLGKYKPGLVNLLTDIISINNVGQGFSLANNSKPTLTGTGKMSALQIRLSSLEIQKITSELVELIARSKQICRHLHIPLQSGNDEILKLMNRPYRAKEYAEKIEYIKSRIPEMGITTDVMVGFPQETEKQFMDTYNFIKKIEFAGLHIFRYSVRPETSSANLVSKVNSKEIKSHMKLLKELDSQLRYNFIHSDRQNIDSYLTNFCTLSPNTLNNHSAIGRIRKYSRLAPDS